MAINPYYLPFIRPKSESIFMKILGVLLFAITPRFMEDFWTTIRLPFCKCKIYYPASVTDALSFKYRTIIKHELVHFEQQESSWGLWNSSTTSARGGDNEPQAMPLLRR